MKKYRNLFLVAAVLWMCLIFSFSARTADVSTKDSHTVGMTIGQMFVKNFDSLDRQEKEEFAKKIDHPVRKSAHFIEYAILGVLSAGVFADKIFLPWILGAFYAATDEFHQLFVPGRSGQLSDVLLDSAGVFTGVVVMFLITRLISKRKRG